MTTAQAACATLIARALPELGCHATACTAAPTAAPPLPSPSRGRSMTSRCGEAGPSKRQGWHALRGRGAEINGTITTHALAITGASHPHVAAQHQRVRHAAPKGDLHGFSERLMLLHLPRGVVGWLRGRPRLSAPVPARRRTAMRPLRCRPRPLRPRDRGTGSEPERESELQHHSATSRHSGGHCFTRPSSTR